MEELDAISAQIDNSLDIVSEYRNSREFAHLMEFISKCCTLGSYNAMLAYTQNPKATIVMSKSKWEKLFNKGIKDNARPLMVLMPFAPVCFCFDYADTYDLDSQPLFSDEKQLMDRVNSIFRPKGDVNKAYLPALKEALKYSGVYVDASLKESPFFGGYITQKKGPALEIDISGKKKVSFPAQFYININTRASENEQLMTLIHETAHLLLQHVDCPSAFDHNCWRTRFDDSNPVIRLLGVPTARDTKETEAEIVKEVLCTKFGIDNKDNCITYLAEYNSFLDKSQFSRELVLNAVCEIEKMITGTYSWKNGLLYKHCLEFRRRADEALHAKQ